jgi:hypothetical protein
MCPDRQILSVYLDDELPSPWKERIEAHLAECPQCRARLEQYRRIGALISPPFPEAPAEAARERIWRNLDGRVENRPPARTIWRRSIPVPMPLAAAAAALLLITFAAALRGRLPERGETPDSVIASGIDLNVQELVPAADMNGVLQYLGRDDAADMVIIRLPESRSFRSAGEPTILKAADYVRRNAPR